MKRKRFPKDVKPILDLFLSQDSRLVEEGFCRLLSGRSDTRLFFILEGRAYTDGRQIVVDPTYHNVFYDKRALEKIAQAIGIAPTLANDPLLALCLMTRSLSCHEALHVLLTRFPVFTSEQLADLEPTRYKMTTLHLLHNIVEDVYIEAAGAIMFDGIAKYLAFGREADIHASKPEMSTIERVLAEVTPLAKESSQNNGSTTQEPQLDMETIKKVVLTTNFLNHVAQLLFFDTAKACISSGLEAICEAADPLLIEASRAPSAERRAELVLDVFALLEPILPDIPDNEFDLIEAEFEQVKKTIGASGETHAKGRDGEFTNEPAKDGVQITTDPFKDLVLSVDAFADDVEELWLIRNLANASSQRDTHRERTRGSGIRLAPIPDYASLRGSKLGGNPHRGVEVEQIHPKPDARMRLAYESRVNTQRGLIRRMRRRFQALITESIPLPETRHLFGGKIVSKDLSRVDGRHWERNVPKESIARLSVCLLIDASGSMFGPRILMAQETAIIIRETLAGLGIPFSCVSHQALSFEEPSTTLTIQQAFNDVDDYKLNLLKIAVGGGNRDGLALAWARTYLNTYAPTERKLLLVISDGMPADIDYYGQPAIEDTAKQARFIQKDGTIVVAIALDDPGETECYDHVRAIYRHTVACDDLELLPRHLLRAIAKHIV